MTPKLTSLGKEIILLGFFDGIGTAAWALQGLIGDVKAYFSWETCSECIAVLDKHFPRVRHRGDMTTQDPTALANEINDIDNDNLCIILTVSGPPCPDYSSVAESAQGREGAEGQKFVVLLQGFLRS